MHRLALQAGTRRDADEIVPASLIGRFRAGTWIAGKISRASAVFATAATFADQKLSLDDTLGYIEILRTHHFDLAQLEKALAMFEM